LIEKFLTLAPVRSPINLISESIDDLSELIGLISSSNPIREIAEVKTVGWPVGYGSIEHDALSPMFTPIMRLSVKQKFIDEFYSELNATKAAEEPEISGIEVLVYDDTLSILVINWKSLQKLSADFQTDNHNYHDYENLFTEVTHQIATFLQKHLWHHLEQLLTNDGQQCWRTPPEFTIYSDYSKKRGQVLWVSRVLLSGISPEHIQNEQLARFYSWCGASADTVVEDAGDIFFVGSGNVICLSDRQEGSFDDLLRALCLMQYYCSILWVYRNLLVKDLAILSHSIGAKPNSMLKLIEKRLDHLDFVELEYAHSSFGTQGKRRQLIEHIASSWKTANQFQMVKGLAQVLRERIERQLDLQRARQNKTIQGILGVIGGLSLLDLALTIKELSRAEQDKLVGLLDLFSLISTDGIIYSAIIIALIVGVLVYRNH